MNYCKIKCHSNHQPSCIPLAYILTEYSLAILCRSLSCSMTEYSECLMGYSFIIRSITSSLRRAVRPKKKQKIHWHTHWDCTEVPDYLHPKCTELRECNETIISGLRVFGVAPTQSALCFSNDILFTQVKLLFVTQVSSVHIYRVTKKQHHFPRDSFLLPLVRTWVKRVLLSSVWH